MSSDKPNDMTVKSLICKCNTEFNIAYFGNGLVLLSVNEALQ